jgi:hypothetical protein
MRPLLLLGLATTALLASGCGGSICQDLGERLCECTPAGTTKASCVDSVKAEIQRNDPSKDACGKVLKTCYARTNPETGKEVSFCEWMSGRCGKASCGLSAEDYATLSGYDATGSPITPDPDDPAKALCPQ